MKDRYKLIIIAITALILICNLIFDADYMSQMTNAEGSASPGDAVIIEDTVLPEPCENKTSEDSTSEDSTSEPSASEQSDLENTETTEAVYPTNKPSSKKSGNAGAASVIEIEDDIPDKAPSKTKSNAGGESFKPVGDKHPMKNSEEWWPKAKEYIKTTFGVTDGVYNTTQNAPNAGGVWCAGLVSRVINNTYPDGKKVAVTESVATLYTEMINSKKFTFIADGYVGNFADIITKTRSGDIMLLKKKNSSGNWEWTHTNLITYYGYIYSQGAGGKIRMNTFDNYNQYGAYDANVSAGYYFYIYRVKDNPPPTPTPTPTKPPTPTPTPTPTPNTASARLTKVTKPGYGLYTQDSTRYSLQGAKYTVSNEDGSENYYLETDAAGVAHLLDASGNMTGMTDITGLKMGTYYAWETKSSLGYKLDSECSINSKKAITLSGENPNGTFVSEEIPEVFFTGGIQLIKKPSVSGLINNSNYSLEAVYTVYNSNGNEVGKINTDKNGYGMISGLLSGTYRIKETTPGRNYQLDTNTYKVSVAAGIQGSYICNGVDYSAIYDPVYYRQANPDLQGFNDQQLLEHFAYYGLEEGRRASAYFDIRYYAAKHGIGSYRSAFEYYLGYGLLSGEQCADYDSLDKTEAGVYGTGSARPVVLSIEEAGTVELSLNINKVDKYSGVSSPLGEGELSGAVFRINYYGVTENELAGSMQSPQKTWYIETKQGEDGNYHAYLDEGYLSNKYESSDIPRDENGNVILPYGYITIEETDSPKGYKKEGIIYEGMIQSGEVCQIKLEDQMDFDGNITVKEECIRGDIKLSKHEYEGDAPMSGVEFEIRNIATDETLIITTDENGNASTSGMWMNGSKDDYVTTREEGKGALPFGKYMVTELRCDANKGKQLEPPIEINIEEEKIYDAYDPSASEEYISNVPKPCIGTTAHIKDSELDEIPVDGEVTIIDKVSYKYLRADTDYTLVGKLMIRDEDGGREEYRINGEPVTVRKEFHTETGYQKSKFEKNGEVEVTFEGIKVSDLPGKSIVVFETLYLGKDTDNIKQYEEYPLEEIFPVEHADINDEGQTLHVADIGTTAHERGSDSQNIVVDGKVTIIDTVEYMNLTAGKTYKIEGKLYNRLTGDAVMIEGNPVTSEKSFVPDSTAGTVDVEFIFDMKEEKISSIVVFEKLYNAQGNLLVDHSDINNDKQTVYISPKITTEATTEVTTEATTEKTTEKNKETITEKNKKKSIKKSATSRKAEVTHNPKTGDTVNLVLLILVMIISLGSAICILYRKRKGYKNE